MAGTYVKPKVFNRHFIMNIGTADTPDWVEITYGFSSRGNNISENSEDYFYFSDRGLADSEPTTQTVERTFSGNRFIGDPAQDAIFIDRMYDMGNRDVQILDYYDNMPTTMITEKGNGWKYNAALTISDDGSGETATRETIGFAIRMQGTPVRGTVTAPTSDAEEYTFAPMQP